MTMEGAVCRGITIIFLILCIAALLTFAGAVEIERRAERWDRYERWMHPPDDDDDGISLLEDDDENSRRS